MWKRMHGEKTKRCKKILQPQMRKHTQMEERPEERNHFDLPELWKPIHSKKLGFPIKERDRKVLLKTVFQ